jgi:hypothetical protein
LNVFAIIFGDNPNNILSKWRRLMERKVKNVAIIGAGQMGFGIGVEYARFRYNVS